MNSLTIAQYDGSLAHARRQFGNRIWEAFQPTHFDRVGYPSIAKQDFEIAYYFDTMRELGFDTINDRLLNGLTKEEFDWCETIVKTTARITEQLCGRRSVPKGALMAAIFDLRYIRALVPPTSIIFEAGAGSGYLGALLGLSGYRYYGTDVTQGFYLWQNRLWSELFGESFAELVTSEQSCTVTHVPWWKFVLQAANFAPITLAVANCSLAEMHQNAMLHFAWSVRQWNCPLLVEGFGDASNRTPDQVEAALARQFLKKIWNDQYANVFTIPPLTTERSNEGVFGSFWKTMESDVPAPQGSDVSWIGEAMDKRELPPGERVPKQQLLELLTRVAGRQNILTQDEVFWKAVWDV